MSSTSVPPSNSGEERPAAGESSSLGPADNGGGVGSNVDEALRYHPLLRAMNRRLMTPEEIKRYHFEAAQSDGFDVTGYNWALNSNVIRSLPPGTKNEKADFCANLAINQHNKENKEKGIQQELQLLEITKINTKPAAPRIYYLTLSAVDKAANSTGEPLIYQAMVSFKIPRETSKVLIMRPKPENPEPKLPWGANYRSGDSSDESEDNDSDDCSSSCGDDDSDLLASCSAAKHHQEKLKDIDLDGEQELKRKFPEDCLVELQKRNKINDEVQVEAYNDL